MSERIKNLNQEILKAMAWLEKKGIEDPDGHLAAKCAREKIAFLEGRIK
jgi:hypothetical protein